jgi:hypothetical protein
VDVVTILNGQATVYILCGMIGLVFLGRRSAAVTDPASPAGPPSAQ